MGDIGAEVGLKMRSAIKAKLMELDCYVDDELPDYIMVMVANKRTKSQMKEDLSLFLNTKTTSFVDWLHIVLRKLKEVHVTNPEILKNSSKRKSGDETALVPKKVKKEKKSSKSNKSAKKNKESPETTEQKSLTDDLPITPNKLTEVRKIVVMKSNSNTTANNEDTFDIPLLSEVDNLSNEAELKMIERRINSVKSRLGIQVESSSNSEDDKGDKSEDEDFINIKADPEELLTSDITAATANNCTVQPVQPITRSNSTTTVLPLSPSPSAVDRSHTPPPPSTDRPIEQQLHSRIVYHPDTTSVASQEEQQQQQKLQRNNSSKSSGSVLLFSRGTDEDDSPRKKRSVLERLGKRPSEALELGVSKRRVRLDEEGRQQKQQQQLQPQPSREDGRTRRAPIKRASHELEEQDVIHHRIGLVRSKVSIPEAPKPPKTLEEENSSEEEEMKVKSKGVASVIKVKPRILPPASKQANKSLLLKAVAEAQRSVAQTPTVGSHKRDAMFSRTYKDKIQSEAAARKAIAGKEKTVLRNMLTAIVNNNTSSNNKAEEASSDDELEYKPKPLKQQQQQPQEDKSAAVEYKPSPVKRHVSSVTSDSSSCDGGAFRQQFIVTLDGVDAQQFTALKQTAAEVKRSISPIVFDSNLSKNGSVGTNRSAIPDVLPIVSVPGLKGRERCKFWPNCKSGVKCVFHHPAATAAAAAAPAAAVTPSNAGGGLCKLFPNCKFGDKCLYLHPLCKFETSCTRRDCPYSHNTPKAVVRIAASQSICKYHPKCVNAHCTYIHPSVKACKFGKYCKNQQDCLFTHLNISIVPKPASFTWHSKS